MVIQTTKIKRIIKNAHKMLYNITKIKEYINENMVLKTRWWQKFKKVHGIMNLLLIKVFF